MGKPFAQPYALLHLSPVNQQPYTVPGIQSDLRQRERGIGGQVELAQVANFGAQQTPGIDHQPHRLAALHLVNLGYVLASACSCRPADVAELVAFAVFA